MKFLVNFLNKMKRLLSHRQEVDLSEINSAEDFQTILRRERARADRGNKKFSLLVFEVEGFDENSTFTKFLVKFLSSRVRLSDVIGWFNENNIGILLPDTTSEGAYKLAEEIRQKVALTISSPACKVYMYPSPKWPGKFG